MADPISEHLSREVTSDIQVLLRDLKKTIKTLTLYPDDNPLPTKMRATFGARFVEVVDEFNGFVFSIRPNEIVYGREVVYKDQDKDDALASIFYNTGIIYLEFRVGLSLEEFNTFLNILKTFIKDHSNELDLVSLMWQEQFTSIKFKTVDDLALGDCETDITIREMYPDYDNDSNSGITVDYNHVILEEESDDASSLGTSTVSPQAVEDGKKIGLSLGSIPDEPQSPIEQLLSGSFTPADEEQHEIARLLKEARQFDPDRSAAQVMIEILDFWDDRKAFAEAAAICEKIFDQLLTKGAFAVAADFVHILRSRQKSLVASKPVNAERLADSIRRAGDDRHISMLTNIINRQGVVDTASIEIYLDSLGWESLVHISGMLGQLVSKKARLMVCDYLAKRGRDHINIIANGLRDKRWYVIRNTVMILGHIGGEQVLPYLASASDHTDYRVRKEIIRALSKNKAQGVIEPLFNFLKDPEPKLRATSLNHLARIGGREAFESIHNIVHSPTFAGYPIEEQEQLLVVYSRLGGSEVTDFLDSIVGSFSLFNSGWKARYRFMALKALAYNTSGEAEDLILKYTRSRRGWLRQAATNALEQRRKFMHQKERESR